jgi:Zn finger protein HypA/HybF involved in hydrogenase expression
VCIPRAIGEAACKHCGYDMTGLISDSAACPECGTMWTIASSGESIPRMPPYSTLQNSPPDPEKKN